jgi:ABC-type glycerol-3-phosphate transport system substrate-binding protein
MSEPPRMRGQRMVRRRLGLGALGGGAALLAACGPTATSGGGPAGASKEPVELTLAVRNIPAEVKSWENVFGVFVEQSNGRYRGNFLPTEAGEDLHTEKVYTLMAGGTPPDVFNLVARFKADFAGRKLVTDLTTRIRNSKTARPDLYFKPMQEAMAYQGKLWGTAEDYNTTVIFLNLSLFKEAGIAPPRLDWTYDEYRDLARRLRQPEKEQWGGDNWLQGAGLQNITTLWSFGKQKWISDDGTKAQVNAPPAVQAHQAFQQLAFADRTIPSQATPAAAGKSGDQGYFGIWAGWANKPWQLQQVNQGSTPYEWTMHPFPRGPADQKQGAQGHLYAIPSGAPRQDDAWVLAEWIGGLEGWKQFVKLGKGIPLPMADRALWDAYYDYLPKEKANELIDLVLNRFYPQYSMDISYPPYYAELQKIMADAERQMFGPPQAAPKATLDEAARLMQAVLDQQRESVPR